MMFKHFVLSILFARTLCPAPASALETIGPAGTPETIGPVGVQATIGPVGTPDTPKPVGIREGFIQVPGGKIWYRAVGTNKTGIPLLALHGGPGEAHDYLEPLEGLGDDRMVVFFDQMGCGNSDAPDDPSMWTIENYILEINAVRKALDLDRIVLLGQSWGSMLALDYLLTKPEGVVGVIFSGPLLSASRFNQDLDRHLRQLPENARKAIKESEENGDYGTQEYQDALDLYSSRFVCRLFPPPPCLNRSMQKFGMQVYEHMWGPSEFDLTGTLKNYERADRLKEIAVPVLYTCGRYDQATPATTDYYRSQTPGSEMVVFENASSEHHLEKKEEYLKTVRGFLGRAEKSGILLTRNDQASRSGRK